MKKGAILGLLIALFLGGILGYYFGYDTGFEKAIKISTSEITPSQNQKADRIKVTYPSANELIKSPLKVSGEARGSWFFEASFPVFLYDSGGSLIAQAVAQAQGDWMTEEFVPFETTLIFEKPEDSAGELVLKKDNPSGLPENEDQVRIPVRFR